MLANNLTLAFTIPWQAITTRLWPGLWKVDAAAVGCEEPAGRHQILTLNGLPSLSKKPRNYRSREIRPFWAWFVNFCLRRFSASGTLLGQRIHQRFKPSERKDEMRTLYLTKGRQQIYFMCFGLSAHWGITFPYMISTCLVFKEMSDLKKYFRWLFQTENERNSHRILESEFTFAVGNLCTTHTHTCYNLPLLG